MIDNVSLRIEEIALRTGSHIEAVLEFCELNQIYDYEDLLEVLHPTTKAKLEHEFIRKNFIPGKKHSSIDDLM